MDGGQQHVVLERLRQEVERAGFHRLHGRRDVAIAGDEDHRDVGSAGELRLQPEAAEPRESDIEHEAAGNRGAKP
jgi:hypothetical protein